MDILHVDCCVLVLQVIVLCTSECTSLWAGDHTDATAIMDTVTGSGPGKETQELRTAANLPHTVSVKHLSVKPPSSSLLHTVCVTLSLISLISLIYISLSYVVSLSLSLSTSLSLFHSPSFSISLTFTLSVDTPSQRVQFLLGMEDEDEEHIPHALFTELDEICLREGEDAEWKETARYTHTHTEKQDLVLHISKLQNYASGNC